MNLRGQTDGLSMSHLPVFRDGNPLPPYTAFELPLGDPKRTYSISRVPPPCPAGLTCPFLICFLLALRRDLASS